MAKRSYMIWSHTSPSVRELRPQWPPVHSVNPHQALSKSRSGTLRTLSLQRSCLLVPTANSSHPPHLPLSLSYLLASNCSPPLPPVTFTVPFIALSQSQTTIIYLFLLLLSISQWKANLLHAGTCSLFLTTVTSAFNKYPFNKDALNNQNQT